MANVKRSEVERYADPLPDHAAPGTGYDAGGHIAQLQADLAQRLLGQGVAQVAVPALVESPGERAVRLFSVAGGYVALLAGYAVAAAAIAWLL